TEIKSKVHESFFNILGTGFRKLTTPEIKKLLYGIISMDDEFRVSPSMSVREELIQSQIRYFPEFFQIGNQFLAVLTLKNLPDDINYFDLDYILDFLQFEYMFVSAIQVPNQMKEKTRLTILRNTAKSAKYKSQNVDHEAEQKYQEAEDLKGLITAQGYSIVLSTQKIVIWNKDIDTLKQTAEYIQNIFKKREMFFFPEELFHDKEFFRSLPAQTILSERGNRVLSPNALALLPLSRIAQGDLNQPFPLFLRTTTGQLYGFDAGSDLRANWNASVYGASGSGKSVTMNMIIAFTMYSRIKAEGGKIFIIDFAGAENSSYRKMAQLFGGSFIPIDSTGKYSINPFPSRTQIIADGEFDASQLTFLSIVCDMIVGNTGDGTADNLKRGIISKAITGMYRDIENPSLRDLPGYVQNVDSEDTRLKSEIYKLLEDFLDVSNPASKIIAGNSNIEYSNNPFVIFDLQGITGLTDRMKQLLTFIVIQEAKKTAFKTPGFKFLIMDECAQLIKQPAMADLVEEMFATARKYRTGVWTVTQNFLSFKETNLSSKIKINTTTTIFLTHAEDPEAKRLVAADFGFTQQQKEAFESLRMEKGKYSLALFLTTSESGQESAVVRMELSPFGFQLAQSDRKQNDYIEAVSKKYKVSIIRACQMIASGEIKK
ncbi:MAG: ATP-binding protein, partial [Spirochaetia bacterium]|nr:ATP-binding protein [Spirochaetia bacterium]